MPAQGSVLNLQKCPERHRRPAVVTRVVISLSSALPYRLPNGCQLVIRLSRRFGQPHEASGRQASRTLQCRALGRRWAADTWCRPVNHGQ
jgi:hypothetical protein